VPYAEFLADPEHAGRTVALASKAGTLANDAMDIFLAAYGSEAGVAGECFMYVGI